MHKSKNREITGQAVVEGAAALVIIVFALVAAIGVIFNTIAASYYQEKLAFVSSQAANFAQIVSGDPTKTTTIAQALGTAVGLTVNKVTVSSLSVAGQSAYSVTLNASAPVGFHISLSDTSVSAIPTSGNTQNGFQNYNSMLAINPDPGSPTCYYPGFIPPAPLPNTSWAIPPGGKGFVFIQTINASGGSPPGLGQTVGFVPNLGMKP